MWVLLMRPQFGAANHVFRTLRRSPDLVGKVPQPSPDESMLIIRFKNPRGIDFPKRPGKRLLSKAEEAQPHRRGPLVRTSGRHSSAAHLLIAITFSGSLAVPVRAHLARNLPPLEATFGEPGIGARRGALDELVRMRKVVG